MLRVLVISAVLLFATAATAVQKVEIYTYDVLPPLAYRDEAGNLTGIYIEIVKRAVSRMPDYSVTFNVVPWARAKHLAMSGEAFAILPPYFHAHDWLTTAEPRRPYLWPYSLSLFTQHDVVVCNERVLKKPRIKYPEDFAGLTFAMWQGDGRAGEIFKRMVDGKKIELHLLKDVKSTIFFLLQGRADCTVSDQTSFAWYMKHAMAILPKNQDGEVKLKEVAIVSSNDGFLAYTDIGAEKRFPFKKDFSIKFDVEIYKMKRSGEVQGIVNEFIR